MTTTEVRYARIAGTSRRQRIVADDHPGRVDADARGDVGSGDPVGDDVREDLDGRPRYSAPPGAVGARAADLRAAALMARAIEPPPVRALILDLAVRLGWGPSEVERLTFGEAQYIIRRLTGK